MNQFLCTQFLICGCIGWLTGLLVNFLADVLPVRRRITRPFCRNCGTNFSWHLSMVLLPQRCASCGTKPGWRWSIVQAICLAGFVWLSYQHPEALGLGWSMFWLAYLLLVIVIDVERRLIMHIVAVVGAAAGIVTGININGIKSTLVGGAIGFLIMLVFYGLGIVYARWSSRRQEEEIAEGEALGFGDVTFSLVMGLVLGVPNILYGLVTAILLAGLAGLLAIIPSIIQKRYNPNLALPYGPFLALSIFYWLIVRG